MRERGEGGIRLKEIEFFPTTRNIFVRFCTQFFSFLYVLCVDNIIQFNTPLKMYISSEVKKNTSHLPFHTFPPSCFPPPHPLLNFVYITIHKLNDIQKKNGKKIETNLILYIHLPKLPTPKTIHHSRQKNTHTYTQTCTVSFAV